MRNLTRWGLAALLLGLTALTLCQTLDPTYTETLEFLVYGTAIPATTFAVTYGLTTPWWTTMIGRALLVSSSALALLVDLSLVSNWWGIILPEWVVIGVFALIFTGAWLKLLALAGQKWEAHKERRPPDAR